MKTTPLFCFLALIAATTGTSGKTRTGIQRFNGHDFSIKSERIEDDSKDGSRAFEEGGKADSLYASWILRTSFPQRLEYLSTFDNDFDHEEDEEDEDDDEDEEVFGQRWRVLHTRAGKEWKPGPPKKEPDAAYDPNWKPPKMNIDPDQKIVKNTLRCSQRTHKCKGMVLYENGSGT